MAPSRLLTNVTVALAALASLLLQVAMYDRQPVIWTGWAQLVVAVVIAVVAARWDARWNARSWWVSGLSIGALVLLPIVWGQAARGLLGIGDPYEVTMAYTLRNLMLWLAASRGEARTQHFAGLASFFLVLFSFLWTVNVLTVVLLIAYSLLGMWWLLGCYWDGIQGRFADQTEQAVPVRPALTAIGSVFLLVVMALPIVRSSRVATALEGFFPSSGGSRWSDDFAHGGVGDGNQMIAGKDNATSFGPVDTELFLESKMPSLYDVFNEQSEGGKFTKRKTRQRAIPLAPTSMQANHKRLGQNQQANREFDAIRRRPSKQKPNTNDHQSPALLQVRGRVPLHLGLYAYDTWDGRTLSSSSGGPGLGMELDKNGPDGRVWLRLARFFPEPLFNHTEQHQVRVINLKTDRVPAPPNPTAVNLDYLHDARMFKQAEDGLLRLDTVAIPQLTVFNVESRRLPRSASPRLVSTPPSTTAGRVGKLAQTWTADVDPGWPQVMAIAERLRAEYQLDPAAMVPEESEDAVEHFLFESKRGPDYLFATAAALMARSLGYEARVRSGLYARPENYKRIADLTSIYKEDAHFWLEVRSSIGVQFDADGERHHGSWITVDPSPGYEVLYTPETLLARLTRGMVAALRAAAAHPLLAALITGLLAAVAWFRVPLLDGLVTAWWGIACRLGDARHHVLSTVRLLERRAWLRSQPRPRGTTIGRWQLHDATAPPEFVAALAEFRRFASWAMYSDGAPAIAPADQIQACCREAARAALRSHNQSTPIS